MRKLILLISVIFVGLEAQENQIYSSQEGRYFLVGFMKNALSTEQRELHQRIYIGARNTTEVTIIHPDNTIETREVPQYGSIEIEVPTDYEHSFFEQVLSNYLYRIVSEKPVAVYAYSTRRLSTDMYTVFPVQTWGREYILTTVGNDYYSESPLYESNVPRTGEALIMASFDNTNVEILLNSNSRTRAKGETIELTMNRGESYLLGGQEIKTRGSEDLTGTIISSDKPIGVLSGHMRSSIPQSSGEMGISKDHLVEMMTPTSNWDTEYVTVPFNTTGNTYVKILAKEDNTTIQAELSGEIDHSSSFNLERSLEFNLNKLESLNEIFDYPVTWRSDKPIQIVQYIGRSKETECEALLDPAMTVASPSNKFVNKAFFYTPPKTIDPNYNSIGDDKCGVYYTANQQYEYQQVTILMDKNASDDILLDGRRLENLKTIESKFFRLPGSNNSLESEEYFYKNIRVDPGSHFIESENGKFTLMNYGTGLFDSYAHSVGMNFTSSEINDTSSPILNISEDCKSFRIDVSDNLKNDIGYFDFEESVQNTNIEIDNNYNFETNGAIVSGKVIDPSQDAFFSATFLDYAYNESSYSFSYTGIDIDFTGDDFLGYYKQGDEFTSSFTIKNNSNKLIRLENINLPANFEFVSEPNFPIDIDIEESFIFEVLITASDANGTHYQEITASFECDIEKIKPVEYTLQSPNINLIGYDFEDVYLGDTKTGTITIINDGSSRIKLNRLTFNNNNSLTFNLQELPNTILEPNETEEYVVDFVPKQRLEFNEEIRIFASATFGENENYTIGDSDFVRGRGVAPLFESIEHDFGRVWLGEEKRETFKFINTGNIAGELNFINFENLKSYSENSEYLLSNMNENILPGEEFEFEILFEPEFKGEYRIDALFETNWDLHPEISFRSSGTVIQEEVLPINNCNDTLESEKEYKLEYSILENNGEIPVTINDIYFNSITHFNNTGNDISIALPDNRFIISNYNDITGSQLNAGEELELEIDIQNLDEGIYFIELITVYNNPNENDEENPTISILSEICLNVKEKANPEINISISGLISASPCVRENFEFEIINTGNTDIIIEDLNIDSEMDINLENLDIPLNIPKNESAFFNGSLFIEIEENSSLTFTAKIRVAGDNEIIEKVFVENITAIPENIFGPKPDFIYTIKDNGNIEFEFEFPYSLEEEIECEMVLKADPKLMYLTENDINLYVGQGTISEQIVELEAFHQNFDISFAPKKFKLDISQKRKVNFEMPFLFLLATYYTTEIELYVTAEKCFLPMQNTYNLDLEGVCAYQIRPVEAVQDGLTASIEPNTNQLILEFETPGETPVELTLTDITGAKVSNFQKKFVNNGEHLLYYDLNNLPSGNYFLTFKTLYLTRNRIITKSN